MADCRSQRVSNTYKRSESVHFFNSAQCVIARQCVCVCKLQYSRQQKCLNGTLCNWGTKYQFFRCKSNVLYRGNITHKFLYLDYHSWIYITTNFRYHFRSCYLPLAIIYHCRNMCNYQQYARVTCKIVRQEKLVTSIHECDPIEKQWKFMRYCCSMLFDNQGEAAISLAVLFAIVYPHLYCSPAAIKSLISSNLSQDSVIVVGGSVRGLFSSSLAAV